MGETGGVGLVGHGRKAGRRRSAALGPSPWLTLACLLALAAASAPAQAQPAGEGGEEPVVLTADTLTYASETEVVTAEGDVEISREGRTLLADRVRYDRRQDKVFAEGNVVIVDEQGRALFAERAEVTGDLRDAFVRGVGVLLEDDSRLAASQGTRRGGTVTELDRAVYSPCPLCEDGKGSPLWQIKARRVVYDEARQTVTYRDARLELFGVPVAYTPFFRHPAPGVDRQSGFLAPSFGTTTELGLILQVPYHYVFSPSADFTFSPIITQEDGPVIAGEYRQRHRQGRTNLAGSFAYATPYQRTPEEEEEGGRELRGHIRADGDYAVTESSNVGFDVFLSSDNSYLRRYDISRQSTLTNRAYFEGLEDRNFWTLNGYYFQGLRINDDQDTIPIALPYAQARVTSEPLAWGSHVTVDSDVLGLTRLEGRDTRRVSTRVGWELPYVGRIGDVYRLELSVRGDAYDVDGDPEDLAVTEGEAQVGRVIPRATVDWSWPLAGDGFGWATQLEPMVSFNAAPTGLNDDEIPNEDSRDFEFDETNLFEADRFPGIDRVDDGTKVAYGMRFTSLGPRATEVSGLLGQSYAITGGSTFEPDTGLGDGLSDYVGRLDLRPAPILDLSYRFRLDRTDLEFRRSDLLATFGPSALRFNLGYLNLSREAAEEDDGDVLDSREEIVAGVRAQLTRSIALGAQTRRDLNANETVANQFGLIYTHPCLVVVAGLEQSFTTTGEIEDETAFLVRLSFENLGDIETGSGLFGSN